MADVVGIGSPAVDYFFKTDDDFLKKINLKPEDDYSFTEKKIKPEYILKNLKLVKKSPGGITPNTLEVLSSFKVKTAYFGTVGEDAEGRYWIKHLKEVDKSNIEKKGNASVTFCLLTNDGKNRTFLNKINNYENDFLKNIDFNLINKAKIFHIGPLIKNPKQGISETIKILNKIEKPLISFSPSIFYISEGLNNLKPILKKTHVLFLNKKEIKYLITKRPEIASKELLKYGPKIIVCTKGESGSIITTNNKQFSVARKNAGKIVDATGAGDAYAAGFLYGLLQGKTLEWSAKFATKIAAKSLTDYGLHWLYDF